MNARDALAQVRALCTRSRSPLAKQIMLIVDQVKDDESVPDIDRGDFERRVREELARVAPPGSSYTPELHDRVKTHMTKFVVDELARLGIPPAFAALIGAGIKITPKDPR